MSTSVRAPAKPRAGEERVRFLLLGPLAVVAADGELELGGLKPRELLATLLLNRGRPVSTARLVEALWRDSPAASAEVTLRTHVATVRRWLAAAGEPDALETRPGGYALTVPPELVDGWTFEELVTQGRSALAAADHTAASRRFGQALALWRGPVLADLDLAHVSEAETARLDGLRLLARESRITAELALGRHLDVLEELESLVAAEPFRERLAAALAVALYRAGRQVDALGVIAATRNRLAEELGLDPGPELRALETAILRHESATLDLPPAQRTRREAQEEPVPAGSRPPAPPDAVFAAVQRTAMVGRDSELEALRAQWRDVVAGERRLVLVSGAAGVGKTRLVAELARESSADGSVLLVGRCDRTSVPYQPLTSALASAPALRSALERVPADARTRLDPLLGLTHPSAGAAPEGVEEERQLLYSAVEEVLAQTARERPVLLVLEDAERVDVASSLLVRHLAAHLPERVLVVVCYRDPAIGQQPALLDLVAEATERGLAVRVVVDPLERRDVELLASSLAGEALPAGLAEQVWRHTGGNPFFVTEVVTSLRRSGPLPVGPLPVPAGVRDVLKRRLGDLGELSQRVLAAAAVAGGDVPFDLLARLVDVPEEAVLGAVEEAVAAGFLVESGRSWTGSYAFPHDLMRDAVQAQVPLVRRQRLHLQAAQALLSRAGPTGNDVIAAAAHLQAAGPAADPDLAARWSLRAADEARRVYAWEDAVRHAQAAVQLREQAGPSAELAEAAERTAVLLLKFGRDHARAVQLLEQALESYLAVGDTEAVGAIHSRLGGALCAHHSVMDIARALEHFDAARHLLRDSSAVFHLHRGRMQAAMHGVATATLEESARDARSLAQRIARPGATVVADWGAAWAHVNRGHLAAARATLQSMWKVAHAAGDPYLYWMCADTAALVSNAFVLDPGSAQAWCRRGLSQPRLTSFAFPHHAVLDQLALALLISGAMEQARATLRSLPPDAVSRRLATFLDGDVESAARQWADALAADEDVGDRHDGALNARWLAAALLAAEDDDGAVVALERALQVGVEGPQVPTELAARAELARILAADDLGVASAHLSRCDDILASGEQWAGSAGPVEVARGVVAARSGDVAGCDAAFAGAVTVFAAYQLPWHQADALDLWATELAAAGFPAPAEARREEAWRIRDRLGAVPRRSFR